MKVRANGSHLTLQEEHLALEVEPLVEVSLDDLRLRIVLKLPLYDNDDIIALVLVSIE